MEELERELINIINRAIDEKKIPFEVVRYVVRHVNSVIDSTYKIELLKIQNENKEKPIETERSE